MVEGSNSGWGPSFLQSMAWCRKRLPIVFWLCQAQRQVLHGRPTQRRSKWQTSGPDRRRPSLLSIVHAAFNLVPRDLCQLRTGMQVRRNMAENVPHCRRWWRRLEKIFRRWGDDTARAV